MVHQQRPHTEGLRGLPRSIKEESSILVEQPGARERDAKAIGDENWTGWDEENNGGSSGRAC